LQTATDTIPIVAAMTDPVAFGLAASLARPGANLTGISVVARLEIWGKRLQILLEAIPGASRVGFLAAQRIWDNPTGYAVRQYAKQLGISILGPPLESPLGQAEYRRVFEAMSQEGADGVIISDEPDHVTNGSLIVGIAEATRLPTIYKRGLGHCNKQARQRQPKMATGTSRPRIPDDSIAGWIDAADISVPPLVRANAGMVSAPRFNSKVMPESPRSPCALPY
jgi:ABC transporter substrate binding protein